MRYNRYRPRFCSPLTIGDSRRRGRGPWSTRWSLCSPERLEWVPIANHPLTLRHVSDVSAKSLPIHPFWESRGNWRRNKDVELSGRPICQTDYQHCKGTAALSPRSAFKQLQPGPGLGKRNRATEGDPTSVPPWVQCQKGSGKDRESSSERN